MISIASSHGHRDVARAYIAQATGTAGPRSSPKSRVGSTSNRSNSPYATNARSTPVQNPLVHSQGHTSSSYSIQSQPSSRSSDTTQGTSHSTLFPPPPLPSNASAVAYSGGGGGMPTGNDVSPNDNIMNSVADASSSLFQICVALRQRLLGVPGFSESLIEEEEEADDDTDPVTLLWRTFCRGYPLMLLYNALHPTNPLSLNDSVKEEKRAKAATFKFLQACITELKFPQEECFIITDLYGDDTTGFVKVARVVNRVLDILVQRGLIEDIRPTASDFEQAEKGMKRTQRQHIVSELVTTERTYVRHLESLQAFKHLVEEKGIIPGDTVHDIFLNLNALLDFQRRFLIRVEQTNALPEEEQNWGKLFMLYCEAFRVYEPYIANQRRCEKIVVAEFSRLREAGGNMEMQQMVESPTSLYGFLMKPFQRLSKYPLLLEDLYKKGDLDEERRQDLLHGKEAATSVLSRTNKAVDQEEKAEAVQELKSRVEDWKGHKVEAFGELLLYGTFTVLKNDSLTGGKDAERQYHVYLFETILLCCKNIDPNKPKNKLSNKNLVDQRGKPKLQLKGRIFMQNVTDLVSLAKPGSYTCQIFWKGDPSIENFIIRFTTEEALRKWVFEIETQRRRYRESRSGARNSEGSRSLGTSHTEFNYLQNQPPLENPYKRDVEDDGDDEDLDDLVSSGHWPVPGHPIKGDFTQSRNGSSTSLRSRSTTGESMAQPPPSLPPTRALPPRPPQGGQALTLRTRELQMASQSPNTSAPSESYFSPVTNDSPMSALRTSTSSAMYPFPRQNVSQNGYYEDGQGNTRFTAPAMGRPQVNREGSVLSNGYAPPGRGPMPRPSPTNGPGMHNAPQMPPPPRHRSASSPDIHNGPRVPMRNAGQPPVPDVPAPYQHAVHAVNRSQSNSPNLTNGMPTRNSPQMQRLYPWHDHSSMDQVQTAAPPQPDARGSQHSRTTTPVSTRNQIWPVPPTANPPSNTSPQAVPSETPSGPPSQLKVKVHCPSASQTLTLVVSNNITYQTLKDRIDAKLQRSTNLSLGDRAPRESQVKLKYLDEDDYVSIQSDEDVQTAFETWREQTGEGFSGMGEIELFCTK